MTKQLTPTNDRILIKPIDEGEQMYGNLVIPDLGKEKPEMGTVLAVGPGRQSELDPSKLITVLVPKIGTLRIDFEGEEYYLAQDREILAVVKETEDNE